MLITNPVYSCSICTWYRSCCCSSISYPLWLSVCGFLRWRFPLLTGWLFETVHFLLWFAVYGDADASVACVIQHYFGFLCVDFHYICAGTLNQFVGENLHLSVTIQNSTFYQKLSYVFIVRNIWIYISPCRLNVFKVYAEFALITYESRELRFFSICYFLYKRHVSVSARKSVRYKR